MDEPVHNTSTKQARLSVADLIAELRLRRRWLIRIPLALFLVTAVVTVVRPRTWSASATFVPQAAEAGPSSVAGLAAQFGIDLSSGNAGQSPEFYEALVRSRSILGDVVEGRYVIADDSGVGLQSASLIELFGIEFDDPARRRDEAIERLSRNTSVDVSRETSIVRVRVKTRWPSVSRQVTDRIVDLINEFNLQSRQIQAAAEAEFIAERLVGADSALRQSEAELEAFLLSNRQFERSPQLSFEHDRHERAVMVRQQVHSSLAQAYEQAQIDRVRNTPLITVVDRPERPIKPDRRRLILKSALAILIGTFIAVGMVVVDMYKAEWFPNLTAAMRASTVP